MKTKIDIRTNEAGQLLEVAYHDGHMMRFCLDSELTFEVRGVDGSLTELVLAGIQALCTDPLWENTIVTDIDVWKAADAPVQYWRNLVKGRENIDGVEADRKRYLSDCADFWLVEVVAAYGGGFTCLCETIQVFTTPA